MQWKEFRSHISYLSAKDQELIEQAFFMGQDAHKDQKRKSGEPYFSHPIAVALILAEMEADVDTIIAALLHDTVEDTTLTLEKLESTFDGSVAALVDGVTKLTMQELGHKPTKDEEIETLRKMFTLMQKDIRIMVIKLADRLHNMQTIEFMSPKRQKEWAQGTLDVFVKIADRLCMQNLGDELESLSLAIVEPENFLKLRELRHQSEKIGRQLAQTIGEKLKENYPDITQELMSMHEPKTWEKLKKQQSSESTVMTGTATATVVLICKDFDSCYRTMGALHKEWHREALSFQDYLNAPQLNGYRGLHTTIIMEDGTRVRCKMRTPEFQAYARKGITTYCFDGKKFGILEYLPWAERISPLSKDTELKSADFWDSLQNDILGRSILIHGPSNETVYLPEGSTVLDGAFYLFKEAALLLESITVNGADVPLHTPLQHADAIDVSTSEYTTVKREWLEYVHTGFATAQIRSALSHRSQKMNITIGMEMLQKVLHDHNRGYLEEFETEIIALQAKKMGYERLNDVYFAIADGHLSPNDAYRDLFERTKKKRKPQERPYTFSYTVSTEDDSLSPLEQLPQPLKKKIREVSYKQHPQSHSMDVIVQFFVTDDEKESLLKELKNFGAENLETKKRLPRLAVIAGMLVIMLIWGLDPVFATMFLHAGVTPVGFAVIRSWAMTLLALATLGVTMRKKGLSRIPLNYPSLWIAGVAIAFVSLLTYFTLQNSSPMLYNTILRGNAFLLAAPMLLSQKRYNRFGLALFLSIGGIAILALGQGISAGLVLALSVLICFNIYTVSSARFQKEARILTRYPQFFLCTSVLSALVLLPIFWLSPTLPPPKLLLFVAAYAGFFIGAPYILFYTLTYNIGYASVSPWINASLVVTFVAQTILLGMPNIYVLIPAAVLLVLGSVTAVHATKTGHSSE